MVEKVYYYDCDNINPYHNQALQNYIINNIPDNSMVFFTWKNNDSVLIGNMQSVYNECNLNQLEIERTYLLRRDTAGQTIFNDLGCLNYAFCLYLNNYDIKKQLNVIYQALANMSLPVYINNENEIMLNTKRITENTYMVKGEKCIHVGTIYWDCDKSKRARLLKDKNIKTYVANISDDYPLVTMTEIKKRVLQSLADQYGPVYQYELNANLEDLVDKYKSVKNIYNTDRKYTLILNDNYNIGRVQLYVDMLRNQILSINAYLDNEDSIFTELVNKIFENSIVDEVQFERLITTIENPVYKEDLRKMFKNIKKECYRI